MEEMYWSTFLENMKLTAKAKNFLELLKTKDLPSCIVTDLTTQIQMKKWQILGLNNYINYLVTSEEAGVEKPNARIFEIALSKLKLSASEVIMIGDNEKKDFLGAQQIGIKAYLIRA
jgi:putative hydrolase of the HAD superfamily